MQFEKERKIPVSNPFLVPFGLGESFSPIVLYDDLQLYKVIEIYPYIRKIEEKLNLITKMPLYNSFALRDVLFYITFAFSVLLFFPTLIIGM